MNKLTVVTLADGRIAFIDSQFNVYSKNKAVFLSNKKIKTFLENRYPAIDEVVVWIDPEMANDKSRFAFNVKNGDDAEFDLLRYALALLTNNEDKLENGVSILCPDCGSEEIYKNGKSNGVQRYTCKKCGRTHLEQYMEKIVVGS